VSSKLMWCWWWLMSEFLSRNKLKFFINYVKKINPTNQVWVSWISNGCWALNSYFTIFEHLEWAKKNKWRAKKKLFSLIAIVCIFFFQLDSFGEIFRLDFQCWKIRNISILIFYIYKTIRNKILINYIVYRYNMTIGQENKISSIHYWR
jgi:hypothetical protein